MNYQRILENIGQQVQREFGKGKVADYIPALARVPSTKFGIAVATVEGDEFRFGDSDEPFSIQSMSKVFALSLALKLEGAKLWTRVGREPSGNPFNSLVQLEQERGIPRNPFINAGALVTTDTVVSNDQNAGRTMLYGLQERLLTPELTKVFVKEYTDEVNRIRAEAAASHHANDKRQTSNVSGKPDKKYRRCNCRRPGQPGFA